jgi:gas vesicle protein
MRDTYPMQDKEISVVGAFIAGVTVGVVAGLLLAPRAGPDIRKSLQEYAAHAMNDILETAMRTGKIYVEDLLQRSNAYLDRTVGDILGPSKKTLGNRW